MPPAALVLPCSGCFLSASRKGSSTVDGLPKVLLPLQPSQELVPFHVSSHCPGFLLSLIKSLFVTWCEFITSVILLILPPPPPNQIKLTPTVPQFLVPTEISPQSTTRPWKTCFPQKLPQHPSANSRCRSRVCSNNQTFSKHH